jgi:predicted Zn-dependent protease
MIGQDRIFSSIERALASCRADAAEAVLVAGTSATTRYANSAIHQNMVVEKATVSFRVALGTRIGTASCTSLGIAELKRTLKAATEIARRQKPNPDFDGFAPPSDCPGLDTHDPRTAAVTSKQRAAKLKRVIARGARYSFGMAGALSTSESEVAVLATTGLRRYQAATSASLKVIATGDDSSGYDAAVSRSWADIDASAVARKAVATCRASRSPKEVAPGAYDVVLEPAAVAEIFNWFSFIAFGSKMYEDGSSFLAGRIGERVMGENVTITDDALDPACPGLAFDFEGTPRRCVELIGRGVARGVVHSRQSARRAGTVSTGHALPASMAADGSVPLNLHLDAGSEPVDRLIAGVEDGLLVTRFHYLNGLLEPRRALMTGMTRDGLLRIRKGRVCGGVKNLRFTDSMLDVFSRVTGISSERAAVVVDGDAATAMYLPALRVARLAFTGKTEF